MIWKDWETSKTGLSAFLNPAAHMLSRLHTEVNTGKHSNPGVPQNLREALCSGLPWALSLTLSYTALHSMATCRLLSAQISFF